MSRNDLVQSIQNALRAYENLTEKISDLPDGKWEEKLSQQVPATDLGPVTLQGATAVSAHIVHGDEPPENLSEILPQEYETHRALCALVIRAEAGATLEPLPLGTSAGISAGASGAASFAIGHFRGHSQESTVASALLDAAGRLRNPFSLGSLNALLESDPDRSARETVYVELDGEAQLAGTAGWGGGLTRSLEGSSLQDLVPGDLGGVRVSAKAGVTASLGISGEVQVRVGVSPRPGMVRVRLHKRRGSLVGINLEVSAEVKLTEADRFVDSLMNGLLEVPDGWVDEILQLRNELTEFENRLAGWSEEAKSYINGRFESVPSTEDLQEIAAGLATLPGGVAQEIAGTLEIVTSITMRIEMWRGELSQTVDRVFEAPTGALGELTDKLDKWTGSYERLRTQIQESLTSRARQGITAELVAGINRASSTEALLELDFDPETAGLLCIEAMRGNFRPALERAQSPGASGVEIVGGVLKREVKQTRNLKIQLNLFGFRLSRDFQSWDKVVVEEDVRTGALSVFGQGGAELRQETKGRLSELTFLFDVYGAFERQSDSFYTNAETGFRATLLRKGKVRRAVKIRELLPRHVRGALGLGLLSLESAEALQGNLLSDNSSEYTYVLSLDFPAESVASMFFVDSSLSRKALGPKVWQLMREAVDLLDFEIPHGDDAVPLSSLWTSEAVEKVRSKPQIPEWTALRSLHGAQLADGAYRMAWAYLLDAYQFIEGLLDVREMLQEEVPVKKATKALRRMAGRTVSGPGFVSRPFDAKYLVFALAAKHTDLRTGWYFERGKVKVSL